MRNKDRVSFFSLRAGRTPLVLALTLSVFACSDWREPTGTDNSGRVVGPHGAAAQRSLDASGSGILADPGYDIFTLGTFGSGDDAGYLETSTGIFRTQNGVLQTLTSVPGWTYINYAGVVDDGTVVGNGVATSGDQTVFRWLPDGTIEDLGAPVACATSVHSSSYGARRRGALSNGVIFATGAWQEDCTGGGTWHALRWTPGGGWQIIAADPSLDIAAVSNDGSNVVIVSNTAHVLYRWSVAGGLQNIGAPPLGGPAVDINNSGVIVGVSSDNFSYWRWSPTDGYTTVGPGNGGIMIDDAGNISYSGTSGFMYAAANGTTTHVTQARNIDFTVDSVVDIETFGGTGPNGELLGRVQIVKPDYGTTDAPFIYYPGGELQILNKFGNQSGIAVGVDDNGVIGGSIYSGNYWVAARWVQPSAVPAAPGSISATAGYAGGNNTAAVSWADASTDEGGFHLQRRVKYEGETGFSAYVDVKRPGPDTTSFTDANLTAHATYQYRVQACNVLGCSAYVSSNQFLEITTPTAPANATARAVSTTNIQIGWADESTNETSFKVQRSTRNADGSWQSYVVIDSTAANQTSYADDDVVAGTAYQYHIRACDLTLCSTFAATPVVTPGLIPAAPANIVLSATGPTSVAVAWTDKSSNETSFDLQRRSRNPDGTYGRYSVIAAPAANTTHYADSGLTEGVTYQYRLRACNAGGCSLFVTSKTIIAEVKPAPPANVQAVATSSASVTVSWSDGSSNEADFQLQRRMRNPAGGYGAFADVIRPSANATSYGDSGLVAATSYQYRIRSCNLAGCSVFVSSNYVKTQN